MNALCANDYDNVDKITRAEFDPPACEDPFCCTPTRKEIVNNIRVACGLEPLKNG